MIGLGIGLGRKILAAILDGLAGVDSYFRPDGSSYYFRPDGSSFYKRP